MAFCTQCGHRISDMAIECPKCGTATPISPASSSTPMLQRTFANAPQLRPLGIGEIIDAAIKIYRANAGALLLAVAVVVVPVQIVGALIQTSVIPDPVNPVEQVPLQPGTVPSPTFDASAIWTMLAGIGITLILNWLASQLALAASMRAVSEAYLGERSDWKQSLEFAFRRLGPLVWLSIISALGVFGGYILCFIPGIWLSVAWSVAVPALLVENERGTNALRRSFRLVKGRWWPVLGATFLGQIIASILGFVFGAAFAALSFIGDSAFVSFISSALSAAVSQTLVTPFLAAMIAIIYFDLRVRKEGFDLELLAQHVGGGEPGGPSALPEPVGPSAPGGPGDRAPAGKRSPGRRRAPVGDADEEATEPAVRTRTRSTRPRRTSSARPAARPTEPTPEVPSTDPTTTPEPPESSPRPPPRRRPVRPGFDPNAPKSDDEPER